MDTLQSTRFANPSIYSIKRLRYGWAVYNVRSGVIVASGIPTRLKAAYVASHFKNPRQDAFVFGDWLCGEQ